jgi:hypothetical protein
MKIKAIEAILKAQHVNGWGIAPHFTRYIICQN